MAIPLSAVRASNASLSQVKPALVALFVGGTSGIGESTLRAFARSAPGSKIYVVGRNEKVIAKIEGEIGTHIEFLKADVSLLREVDSVCDVIRKRETVLNILFLSSGIITMAGRNEGLDQKFALHYYSRMRFIVNLLPLLTAGASSEPPQLARVVSVLAAGEENSLIMDDLDLKRNFSLSNCARHAITMNSLMAETFAEQNPSISFVHAYPGIVKTSLGSQMGALGSFGIKAMYFLIRPWTVDIVESGERHMFAASSSLYPPRAGAESGSAAEAQDSLETAKGSDGTVGSGAYLLNWNGKAQLNTQAILKGHRESGAKQKVWDHTMSVFHDIQSFGKL